MNPERLTGFVYLVKKNGVPVRGRFQLWVNLPSEPAFDRDGQPVLDSKGRQRQKYPKTTKVVEAKGKKAAAPRLEHGGDRGTALVRPRPHARLRHRQPHHRGGRRWHAPRVPAEERQGADRALPAAACDELRAWLVAQKEYRLAQGPAWNEAGRVMPKKDGTQMAPSTLKSQWWNWVARQKIDPHLPIHGLRDSFGTWVYETYGVKQAQEWLGHSEDALPAPDNVVALASRRR